ncbi:hypothetical protein VYU27_007426 [Nannochloropsis oceanica]
MFLFGGSGKEVSSSEEPQQQRQQQQQQRLQRQTSPLRCGQTQQTAEEQKSQAEKEAHSKALLLMNAEQRGFLSYEEHEYHRHLNELDTALSAAVPQAGQPYHTHDLSWKSSGTPVRYLFKLPVPVDTAGTHVTYRFASDEFDISFAVFFLGVEEDAKMEIVLPAARVNSHQEPVSGDITVHRPGTVILLWDNTYSWFATKALSYSVHLRYPTGPTAERERGSRARAIVAAAEKDIQKAEEKKRVVQEEAQTLTSEVAQLEQQLALLQTTLSDKKHELSTLHEDALMLHECVHSRRTHLLPLLLRALPASVLLHLASFFSSNDQIQTTNKLFLQLFIQSRPGYQRPPSLSVSASSSLGSSSSPFSSLPPSSKAGRTGSLGGE